MADVSDLKIQEAYLDVRSDKSDTNWLLLDYQSDRSDRLVLTQTGTGGLSELQSQREKFILVVWIGSGCKILRKAKISVHTADVKEVLRVYSIEVAARERDDLKEDPIVGRLRKAGGASYDGI
ncbi:hypothetical protein EDD16DRAFT_1691162 [Pisolithus croceorrhizus]|nr:hypothetical protein EDD16DRAFT_1691162 [Pisolithus croceorrhizus]